MTTSHSKSHFPAGRRWLNRIYHGLWQDRTEKVRTFLSAFASAPASAGFRGRIGNARMPDSQGFAASPRGFETRAISLAGRLLGDPVRQAL
jgi:hypothetical protein